MVINMVGVCCHRMNEFPIKNRNWGMWIKGIDRMCIKKRVVRMYVPCRWMDGSLDRWDRVSYGENRGGLAIILVHIGKSYWLIKW